MPTPADSILNYLRAKDGNRPHLLARAFTADAELYMTVRAGNISFPPVANGRDAIMNGVSSLPNFWCTCELVVHSAPKISAIHSILDYIEQTACKCSVHSLG